MATRIQRKRTKDYTQPLGTIYVGRPTKWGNPFKLTPDGWIMYKSENRTLLNPWVYWSASGGFVINDIIDLYELWLTDQLYYKSDLRVPPDLKELKGANLSCWCGIVDKNNRYIPCHADILLSLANGLTLKQVRNENIKNIIRKKSSIFK